MSAPLTCSSIQNVIDRATSTCASDGDPILSTKHALKARDLVLSRAKQASDWITIRSFLSSKNDAEQLRGKEGNQHQPVSWNTRISMLFGILLRKLDKSDKKNNKCCGFVTFGFSYSTWDGRILYVDRLELNKNSNSEENELCNSSDSEAVEIMVLQTLAFIAVNLDCSRLTWRHTDTPAWYSYEPSTKPRTLHGWLTLSMDRQGIESYSSHSKLFECRSMDMAKSDTLECATRLETPDSHDALEDATQVEAVLHDCLSKMDTSKSFPFQLRLAVASDVESISRLVQGLAIYEKEPDAVHVTETHYLQDGFSWKANPGVRPLFYCLLLDYLGSKDTGANAVDACGMAFFYFGDTFGLNPNDDDGRFLYLEDLFIEEKYRKQGGGALVMQCLTYICQELNCKEFVWQALDWNTPALTFYKKIGANIQEGVLTSRFGSRKEMEQFFSNSNYYEERR